MGYLSPFLNEDLARWHGTEMRSAAALHHLARTARRARPGRAERWKSRLGWALVATGLSLVSQPPGRVRRRGYVLDNSSTRAFQTALPPVLTRAEPPVRVPCGCDA
jgi:hypothetical protein